MTVYAHIVECVFEPTGRADARPMMGSVETGSREESASNVWKAECQAAAIHPGYAAPPRVASLARTGELLEPDQADLPCPSVRAPKVISDYPKLFLTSDPNHLLIPCHPVPRERALAIVTDVGAGSGGRESCD